MLLGGIFAMTCERNEAKPMETEQRDAERLASADTV